MKLIPTAGSFVVNDTSRVKMNQTKIVLFSAFIFLFSNNEGKHNFMYGIYFKLVIPNQLNIYSMKRC